MPSEVFWSAKNVTMEFPGVKALSDVSLDFYQGEILGLLGENGSGKSTLIKCLSGAYIPQQGEYYRKGERVQITNASEARSLGIATVYQEFSLVPTLSITENMFLGRLLLDKAGRVNWKEMRRIAQQTLDLLDIHIHPDTIVGMLSVAEQQLVEIAKGYTANGSLMILDEPTTALTEPDIVRLHALLSRLANEGQTIIYISHRLDEVMEIVERIAILRNGRLVGTMNKGEFTLNNIVEAMSGSVIEDHYPKEHNARDEVVLSVDHICARGVDDASFTVRRGEVFGLAGLLGSGRTEIACALFGVEKITRGSVTLNGKDITNASPQKAIRSGLAYITENRKTDGLFFNFEGPRNCTSAKLHKLFKRPHIARLNLHKERQEYAGLAKKLSISANSELKTVNFLSGGNQQKVVISRWLFAEADVFIMDEPTQGIDIGARLQVYNIINELTRAGKSIILISSDFLELISMSDRIGVVRYHKLQKIIDAKDATKASVFND